jgi:transposase
MTITTSSPSPAVGIDVGKATCHVCIRHAPGAAPHTFTAPRAHVAARVLTALEAMSAQQPAIIALERTGGLDAAILAALEPSPHHLYIAQHTDTAALRTLLRVRRKTDKLDADLICRMVGLLMHPDTAPAMAAHLTAWEYIRPTAQSRDDVRYYQSLIRDRARARTRLQTAAPGQQQQHLQAQIDLLSAQIAEALATVTSITSDDTEFLQSIPLISARRAALLSAAIGDMRRFETPDKLCGYLALKPPARSITGDKPFGRPIIRRGLDLLHGDLHMLALQVAAHPERVGTLGRTYQRIKERTGDGRKAMWAVRRQLIRTAWGVLTSRQPYRDSTARVPSGQDQHSVPD